MPSVCGSDWPYADQASYFLDRRSALKFARDVFSFETPHKISIASGDGRQFGLLNTREIERHDNPSVALKAEETCLCLGCIGSRRSRRCVVRVRYAIPEKPAGFGNVDHPPTEISRRTRSPERSAPSHVWMSREWRLSRSHRAGEMVPTNSWRLRFASELFEPYRNVITDIATLGGYEDERTRITVEIIDARKAMQELEGEWDVCYQDAFSPLANPLLWTREYFADVAQLMGDFGVVTTYSIALATRLALYENGFSIYLNQGDGYRSATVASRRDLSEFEKVDMEHKIACNQTVESLRDESFDC